MKTPIEQKIVFSIGSTPDGPALILGIPAGAWDYIKDGHTNHFDLAAAGIPLKLLIFGGATHDECMRAIEKAAAANGVPLLDERRRDWSIKDKT